MSKHRNEPNPEAVASLSQRELKVFHCVGKGHTTGEIASELAFILRP